LRPFGSQSEDKLNTTQASVNYVEKFGFIVAGVEILSHVVTRYAIFEDLYLDRAGQGSKELKKGLISLYASILLYLSKAKRFLEDSRLSK